MQTRDGSWRRTVTCTCTGALVAAVVFASTARANEWDFKFIGEVDFPTGYQFAGTEVGGLSGISYDGRKGVYYAICDDRSQINPARFYKVAIDLSDGTLDDGDVTFKKVTTILDKNGLPFVSATVDPEAIRINTHSQTLFWASEGDATALLPPFVRQMKLDGTFIRELETPTKFLPTASMTSGVRNNLAFESLAFLPGRTRIVTATENALYQDGPAASVSVGSPSRFLVLNTITGLAQGEYVYNTEPVADAPVPPTAFATNGLVDFVATGDNSFIAMERSFSTGVGNVVRLYLANTSHATDVRYVDSIVGEAVRPINKRLLANLADFGITPDNVEGITFGPLLPDGSRSMILVSDNNFSATQVTQFLAFSVTAK